MQSPVTPPLVDQPVIVLILTSPVLTAKPSYSLRHKTNINIFDHVVPTPTHNFFDTEQ